MMENGHHPMSIILWHLDIILFLLWTAMVAFLLEKFPFLSNLVFHFKYLYLTH